MPAVTVRKSRGRKTDVSKGTKGQLAKLFVTFAPFCSLNPCSSVFICGFFLIVFRAQPTASSKSQPIRGQDACQRHTDNTAVHRQRTSVSTQLPWRWQSEPPHNDLPHSHFSPANS